MRSSLMPLDTTSFLRIAREIAKSSTCTRGSVGAVIVQDRRIVSTGYNGAPPGMPHCTDVGCLLPLTTESPKRLETNPGCQRAIHAEMNAIAWAARHGVATEGATLYSTHGPCLKCAQAMLAAGIERVYFVHEYRLHEGWELLDKASVPTYQIHLEDF